MADYNEYGYHSDKQPHNFSYQLNHLLKLINKEQNKYILDVGCGNGYLANYLVDLGYNVYGTDASAQGINIARLKNPERFFLQDLSLNTLPVQLQGIVFDTIISTEVIEHLYDPQAFISFCKKQLTSGGQLIITTPYHGYLKNLFISLFNKWDSHMNPLWLGGHIKLWSAKTFKKLLTDNGFNILTFKGCGRVPYFWMSMIIKAKLN